MFGQRQQSFFTKAPNALVSVRAPYHSRRCGFHRASRARGCSDHHRTEGAHQVALTSAMPRGRFWRSMPGPVGHLADVEVTQSSSCPRATTVPGLAREGGHVGCNLASRIDAPLKAIGCPLAYRVGSAGDWLENHAEW